MIKTKSRVTVNLLSLIIATTVSFSAVANKVDLKIEIEGQGQVSVVGTKQSCSESCDLKIEVEQGHSISLKQQSSEGYQFQQWLGASCDAGEGAVISYVPTYISSTSQGAKALILDDFNGDLIPDAATIELFAGKIVVNLNDSNGAFEKTIIVDDKMNYPSAMDSADWDGDGDKDLLVVVHGSGDILVYLNDGKAIFSLAQTIKLENINPYSIAVADINNDGKLDLLIGSFEADIKGNLVKLVKSIKHPSLSWFTQIPKNEFELYRTLSTTEGVITLDVGDIDKDGDIDVAAASITGDQAIIYWNDKNKYTSEKVLGRGGVYGVALGDLDNNGLLDLLVGSYWDEKLELVLQTTTRKFAKPKLIKAFSNGVTATSIADIDSDGRVDIGTAAFNDNLFIWLKNNSLETCAISNFDSKTVTAIFRSGEQVLSDKEMAVQLIQQRRLAQLKIGLVNDEPLEAKQWFKLFYARDYKNACEIANVNPDRSEEKKLSCQKQFAGLAETLGNKISHEFIGSNFSTKALTRVESTTAYYLSKFDNAPTGLVVKLTMQKVGDSWRVVNIGT